MKTAFRISEGFELREMLSLQSTVCFSTPLLEKQKLTIAIFLILLQGTSIQFPSPSAHPSFSLHKFYTEDECYTGIFVNLKTFFFLSGQQEEKGRLGNHFTSYIFKQQQQRQQNISLSCEMNGYTNMIHK